MRDSNPYPEALALVHDALSRIREEQGDRLRTPLEVLERLQSPATPAAVEPPPRSDGPAPVLAETPPQFATRPPSDSNEERLDQLRTTVSACTLCPNLAETRTQTVFGVGNPDAALMFVGEAPGMDEDVQGEPFVGKAGQLLTRIIDAMGLRREDVYIANVLKCRPDMPPGTSGNRRPTAVEMTTCLPYLRAQIESIRPQAIVALGAVAMEGLFGTTLPMKELRGLWRDFQGIPTMPTYHPAYLLRNQANSEKRKVWEDMLLVMERLGMPVSAKQRKFFLPKPARVDRPG